MPITFNQEAQSWGLTDPTQEEKDSLIAIARDFIINSFGQETAERIVGSFFAQEALTEIPVEEMHSA